MVKMRLNYCPNCGNKIEHAADVCGSCGADLRAYAGPRYRGDFREQLERMMQDLIQNNEGALREMAEKMAKGEVSPRGMFFSVEMRDGKPIIKSGDMEEFQKRMGDMPLPSFLKDMMQKHNYALEFKEAQAEVREQAGGKVIHVRMPGVASMGDVEINKRSKGLEIAGKTQKTVYFSQVPLNIGDTIVRADLRDGALRIEVKSG
jgi:hypothetical protein